MNWKPGDPIGYIRDAIPDFEVPAYAGERYEAWVPDTVWIEKEKSALVRKGNDVVAIDPPGRVCPLYQRAHYRENEPRWRKLQRFVTDERVYW